MSYRDVIYVFLILVALLAGVWLGRRTPYVEKVYVERVKYDTIRMYDTLVFRKPGKMVVVKDTEFVSRYIWDTVRVDTIFVACMDTMIRKNRISVCYEFPRNEFSVDAKIQMDTVYRVVEVKEKVWNWTDMILPAIGGFLIGLAVR